MEELVRGTGITRTQLESLATAGALAELGVGTDLLLDTHSGVDVPAAAVTPLSRRAALWAAGPVAESRSDHLPGLVVGETAPPLPAVTPAEEAAADVWATGLTLGATAIELARPRLDALGVLRSVDLARAAPEARVAVAGVVTHRQHPETARGATFLTLEDETGIARATCSAGAWARYEEVARFSSVLIVKGRLEKVGAAAATVRVERIEGLDLGLVPPSRDFR